MLVNIHYQRHGMFSTATFVSGECDLTDDSSGITKPRAIDFNNDGTKMRVLSSNTDDVHEFTLTTGFDMSYLRLYR